MTPSLADILHNIADHTDTLYRMFKDEGLDQEFVGRMENHIYVEEKENSEKIKSLMASGDNDPILEKLMDHSFFLQKMLTDKSINRDLKIELLDHFMEEHQEWQMGRPSSHGPAAGFTEASVQKGSTDNGSELNVMDLAPSFSGSLESVESELLEVSQSSGWTVGPMWEQGDG